MKIIGAVNLGVMAHLNLQALEQSFVSYQPSKEDSKEDVVITVTLVEQRVAHHNKNVFGARDLLWDIDGHCYDATLLRKKLDSPPNLSLRIAREK